ncbi:helix-turn-helix domain-containing protein [candidate division KSB1 bacterium]|nr:helix-turn-helix domain-containing protein [candidate division KSB1 bacterium]
MKSEYSLHVALKKILANDFFQEREVYTNLLKYLVQAHLDGITPKEVTIAHEVFNKGTDFNAAEDTTVRVHMYKLRKKLDEYYRSAGQGDPIRIMIPKGHYRVKVVERKGQPAAATSKISRWIIALLLLLLCCATGYIIFDKLYLEQNNRCFDVIDSTDPIWGNFFSNGYVSTVVIGDFLVFHEYHPALKRSRRIQDYSINTKEELKAYIGNYPENLPEEWFLGEVPHNSLINIIDIQPVFLSFKKKVEIRFTTEIDIDFIKNKNIVYIGEFKNLRALSDLIAVLPVNYETLPWWHGKIRFNTGDSVVALQTSHDWGISRYVVDLALVSKLPGKNNENYILIAGFGYNSQVKAVEMLSHKASLHALEEQIESIHGAIPSYFTMVLEVTGFDRASTNAEIKFFQEVQADYYQQYQYPTFNN